MHICYLIQSFNIGGLEIMVTRQCEQLKALGYTVHVIAYQEQGPLCSRLRLAGVNAIFLPKPEGAQPFYAIELAHMLKRLGVQLLHTHHLGPFIYGCQAAHMAGIPLIHTEHSHEFYDTPHRQLIGKSLANHAVVTAVTDEIARFHQQHFGHSPLVIPNGVPVPKPDHHIRAQVRAKYRWSYNEVIVACVARQAPEKDLGTLLHAFAFAVKHSDPAKLVFVGDGPCRMELARLAHRLELQKHVIFLGQRQDLHELYQAFDLVALSSIREGAPLALLEAMSFGLPVLSTDVGGVSQIVDEQSGRLVPARDPQALASALIDYINNPALRLLSGSHARRRVCTLHSIEQMTQRYIQVYQGALNPSATSLTGAAQRAI